MSRHGGQGRRAGRRRGVDLVVELPVITAEDVRARWQAGQLGRVEVYPVPESQVPGSPSSIVRPAAPPVVPPVTFRPAGASAGRSAAAFRFVIDGRAVRLHANAGVIGRSPDAGTGTGSQLIAVTDPGRSLSRNHLGFELDARGRLLVFDLKSANGSEIITGDGERVECTPGRRYVVDIGDALLLGNFDVTVDRG